MEENGISVFFLSTDNEEKAREMADKHGATFPILYGMDGPALSKTWGSFYEERRNILHAAGFILRPDHSIAVAVYSTGPVGRLTSEDVIRIVRFYQKQAAA